MHNSHNNPQIRQGRPSETVKQPAVAGLFYPENPAELQTMLDDFMDNTVVTTAPPKALIVPHAGYVYSGSVAASGYAMLIPDRHKIKRVVLMGPAHRIYLQGVAISTSAQFATPLGLIDVDRQLRDKVSAFPQVSYMDEAFAQEHSLEVHLPFLQTVLDKFTILPLVVGDTPPDQLAALLESVWGGDETLIVISSDLSHFHDYETARRLDSETAGYIKALQGEAIESNRACGCMPMHGLLHLARHKNMTVNILDLKNSGDTAGSRDRVVGYGTFSFHEA